MAAMATLREKGQVTIPASIRRAANLEEGAELEFELVDGGVLVRPVLRVDDVEVDEAFARMVIETTAKGYDRLRRDEAAWRDEQAVVRELDAAASDGLDGTE